MLSCKQIHLHSVQRFNLLQHVSDFSQSDCVTLICYANNNAHLTPSTLIGKTMSKKHTAHLDLHSCTFSRKPLDLDINDDVKVFTRNTAQWETSSRKKVSHQKVMGVRFKINTFWKRTKKNHMLLFFITASSYLVRWNHGCDENPCKVGGVDCPYHEAWLDQSDLR